MGENAQSNHYFIFYFESYIPVSVHTHKHTNTRSLLKFFSFSSRLQFWHFGDVKVIAWKSHYFPGSQQLDKLDGETAAQRSNELKQVESFVLRNCLMRPTDKYKKYFISEALSLQQKLPVCQTMSAQVGQKGTWRVKSLYWQQVMLKQKTKRTHLVKAAAAFLWMYNAKISRTGSPHNVCRVGTETTELLLCVYNYISLPWAVSQTESCQWLHITNGWRLMRKKKKKSSDYRTTRVACSLHPHLCVSYKESLVQQQSPEGRYSPIRPICCPSLLSAISLFMLHNRNGPAQNIWWRHFHEQMCL